MGILGVRTITLSNFKSARSLLSTVFFVRAARALHCERRQEFGGVGIYDSEDRQIFSDLSEISTTLEHGFYVRARRTSTESSTARWVMTIEVRLKIHSPMHSMVDVFSVS